MFFNIFKRKGKLTKGQKYEKKIVNKLKLNGIDVVSVNKDLYDGKRRITDIDIETRYANIEVKTSKQKSGIGNQLRKYKKYSKKEPIGMAPYLNDKERLKLHYEGFNVFSKERNLVRYLKKKNKNPNFTKIVYDPKKRGGKKNGKY